MSRQKTTIFAYLGKGHRCRGQAFFDKCLSTFNCMAASSYVPPVGMKMTAFDFSKVVILERDKLCCTTAFFLLPSCGTYQKLFTYRSKPILLLFTLLKNSWIVIAMQAVAVSLED